MTGITFIFSGSGRSIQEMLHTPHFHKHMRYTMTVCLTNTDYTDIISTY